VSLHKRTGISTFKIASTTSRQHGWDVIITAAASTAVDLDDQNLTDWRTCCASTGTTDRAMHGCAVAPVPGLTGETNSGFTSADIVVLDSDFGETSAEMFDLSDDLLVCTVIGIQSDDLLVCIFIGEGGGFVLAVLVFGIWPDVFDAIEFCLRWALLAPLRSEPVDCATVLLRLLLVF